MKEHLAIIEQYVEKVEDWTQLAPDPVVSVCMITYNHESFIAEAIEGTLMQETNFPYEIIIGEDKSTDGTRDIVLDYQRRFPDKIRLRLAKENLYSKHIRYPGLGVRNAARGRYIALCEGDDYWTDPHKLVKQAELLDSSPDLAMCFTAAVFSYVDSNRDDYIYRPKQPKSTYSLGDMIVSNQIATCTVLFRRALLQERLLFMWTTPVGDWPLYTIVAREGRIGYIDETCAVRNVHEGGVWSSLSAERRVLEEIKTRELVYPSLSLENRKLCHGFLLRKYKELIRLKCQQDDHAAVRRIAWTCMWHSINYEFDVSEMRKLIKYAFYMTPPHRLYIKARYGAGNGH